MPTWVTSAAVQLYIIPRWDGAAVDTPGSTSAPRYLWPTLLHDRSTPGQQALQQTGHLVPWCTQVALHALNRAQIRLTVVIAGHTVIVAGSSQQQQQAAVLKAPQHAAAAPSSPLRRLVFPERESIAFALALPENLSSRLRVFRCAQPLSP